MFVLSKMQLRFALSQVKLQDSEPDMHGFAEIMGRGGGGLPSFTRTAAFAVSKTTTISDKPDAELCCHIEGSLFGFI